MGIGYNIYIGTAAAFPPKALYTLFILYSTEAEKWGKEIVG
jgi:hypothetical protein